MGYTLIAVFEEEGFGGIRACLDEMPFPINKIPYGRCDNREEDDRILPWHSTLFHWGKAMDELYLPNFLEMHCISRFEMTATSVMCTCLSDGSAFLHLPLRPGRGFQAVRKKLEWTAGTSLQNFFHMTLGIDTDMESMKKVEEVLKQKLTFPITLSADRLELYHIWKPVRLVKTYPAWLRMEE